MTTEPREAVLYARFSPRPNPETCDSIETQLERLRAWSSGLGYVVVKEFTDANKSGASTDHRPGLEEAIDWACSYRCILAVYSLSRLARSTKDALDIAHRLERSRADLASIHERIDTASPQGRFTFTIFAAMAQLEREIASERTSYAMRKHQREGRRMGRVDRIPYGMRNVNGSGLEPCPDEQETIRLIRQWFSEGNTLRGICRMLDAAGRGRRGKTWYPKGPDLVRAIVDRGKPV